MATRYPGRDRKPTAQAVGETHPCKVCARPFLKDHGRRVTCSPECSDRAQHPTVETHCTWCDRPMTQQTRSDSRIHRPACSKLCISALGIWSKGTVSSAWSPPKPKPPKIVKPRPEPFREVRECTWCGDEFTARLPSHVYCSKDHKSRAIRVRRVGRRHGWDSHFTLAELIRIFHLFGRRCAYCEQPIDGLPQPDHVVPLSKDGPNSITNILPCCPMCNSDKRDLLLSEWNADRVRRGLEPRVVAWTDSDPRVRHLTFREVRSAA